MLMLGLPLVFIPLVGLAIDGTRLYIVQAKLSAAVDGAALGAGRLLATSANTSEIAGEFLSVNFPAGYWGTTDLTPTINVTNSFGTHTINVAATVKTPLLFMRIFGQQNAIVASNAVATRRNTRVELILDQSGSMSSTMASMLGGAKQFTGMFTPGTDELGLVAFAGSAIVAYPPYQNTTTWDPSPTSSTQFGPDSSFATTSTAGPMFTELNLMTSGGGTNTPESLALAYIELQKAHNHAVAGPTGTDDYLNSVVLFTDGQPTALSTSPNRTSSNALKPFGVSGGQSPCTYNANGGTIPDAAHTMAGFIYSDATGLYLIASTDTTAGHTVDWWLANSGWSYLDSSHRHQAIPTVALAGCAGFGNSLRWNMNDLNQIPAVDLYGNSVTGYKSISLSDTSSAGGQWANAVWNATDNVGNTIRNNGVMGSLPAPTGMLPITIFTIGYTGNGGIDTVLLKRLANTQDSTSYTPTQGRTVHSSRQRQ
ncbi:MAG: VWA domain-containing protein [Acidobacteriia bacterium]|nr:VWA domain-containing protein [Terriglobia bacterium]